MRIDPLWRRRLGLGLLAVLLLAALAWVVMRSGPLAPTRVTVSRVETGQLTPALFGIGTVEARRLVSIGPTSPGRVRSVSVDVGDTVSAGQVLAQIDPVDLDQRLAALNASIERAGSAAAAAAAQRQDAQARQRLAAMNAQRYVALGEQNFISTGAVEARLQEQASATAMLNSAQANLAAAQQDLQRLRAEREGALRQIDNLRLRAPIAGLVIGRDAEPGATVVAGQAVLRVIDPASLWARVRFDQGRSAGLASGLPARIVLRSNPATALAGRVVRVEAVSDSVTEERIAMVAFDAPPPGLAIGVLAEVTLSLAPTDRAVLVPNASVHRQGGQTGVWRVDAGALAFAPVRLGASSLDGQVQVLDGLDAGDTIVVYSEKALAAGSRITVVDSLTGRGE